MKTKYMKVTDKEFIDEKTITMNCEDHVNYVFEKVKLFNYLRVQLVFGEGELEAIQHKIMKGSRSS